MLKKLIIYWCFVVTCVCLPVKQQCLTGYMTEVQSWVDYQGVLIATDEQDIAIDLSSNANPVLELQHQMSNVRESNGFYVKYLSMARCNLTMVPTVFLFNDSSGQHLGKNLEYLTLYGNRFCDVSLSKQMYDVSMNATDPRETVIELSAPAFSRKSSWSRGFKKTNFPRLKELDLRACYIQTMGDHIFEGMPNLEALYIGENQIFYINANTFAGLKNLIHLDFSNNKAYDEKMNLQPFLTENIYVFEHLTNLLSLDLSFTKLTQHHVGILRKIKSKLLRLSLCKTGLTNLEDGDFNSTSLRILDISGNNGIFGRSKTLAGLEKTLQVLYARDAGLRNMQVFDRFDQLEILDVSENEISVVSPQVMGSLKSLKILNLDINRVTTWFSSTFSLIPTLKLLSLKENNINLISEEMIMDIANIQYLAMSGNFIVCNCHTRDFFDTALHNEQFNMNHSDKFIKNNFPIEDSKVYQYHRGFIDFNLQIKNRNKVSVNCTEEKCYEINENLQGNFLLLDFLPNDYICLQALAESKLMKFSKMDGCNRNIKDIDYDNVIEENFERIFILYVIPGLLFILVVILIFRRYFRYCFITMKNSAILSLIHNSESIDEGTIFHYDVFVSYCNEDRNWVLDHLLPHLESDCSFSACLHERDFQVGHSIFENIVSCMDRSRSIMLVISRRFLLSQWCQFEMHLAQHRLLETSREDLTLVLLEDVPRRLRPNTLQYLMLTKTYILWPQEETERAVFWRRIRRTLVTIKQNSSIEGVSLA